MSPVSGVFVVVTTGFFVVEGASVVVITVGSSVVVSSTSHGKLNSQNKLQLSTGYNKI